MHIHSLVRKMPILYLSSVKPCNPLPSPQHSTTFTLPTAWVYHHSALHGGLQKNHMYKPVGV